MNTKDFTRDNIIRMVIYISGLILIFFLLRYLSVYLIPFFLALITAFILNPIVKFIKIKMRVKSRFASVIITLIGLLVVIFGIYTAVGPLVTEELDNARILFSNYLENNKDKNDKIIEQIDKELWSLLDSNIIDEIFTTENIQKYAPKVVGGVWDGISGVTGIFLSIFVIFTYLLYLLFILIYYEDFASKWQSVLPPLYRKDAVMLLSDMEHEMKLYFRGQSKIVLILCVLFATGFRIIDLPLGILLGVTIGILNFVPYLQLAGIPFALLLAWLSSAQSGTPFLQEAGLVLLVFAIVQGIQDGFLVPKIMGDTTGINPALILLSLSIFGGLLGLVGMLIALPVTSLIIKYYKLFILHEKPKAVLDNT